ncbi:MAG: hypothetical protein QM756_21070 [Polyangiaceae bacterium]
MGANFDVSPKVSLGLRLPVGLLALERSAQNGKDSYVALGLPEILAEYRPEMSSPRWSLPILFGLGIPVATDEPDITTGEAKALNNRTNMVADAARGWRDGELFWSKRVPVILGVGIRHEGRSFEWHAATKFVTGVKISGDIVKADFYGDRPAT